MIKLIYILKEVLLESRSQQTLTRQVRDVLVNDSEGKARPASDKGRIFTSELDNEAFKALIEKNYPNTEVDIVDKKDFAKGAESSQFPTFKFIVDGQPISIVLATGKVRGEGIENAQVANIQQQLRTLNNGEGVTIKVAGETYPGIIRIEKVQGNKKADFQLFDSQGPKIFVQHKSPQAQQMSGIARAPYNNYKEVREFITAVQTAVKNNSKIIDSVPVKDRKLKQLAVYGTLSNTFSQDAVQVYCVGDIRLIKSPDSDIYTIKGEEDTFEYPIIPDGTNAPTLGVTYRRDRNQGGIPGARFGIYPKSYFNRVEK